MALSTKYDIFFSIVIAAIIGGNIKYRQKLIYRTTEEAL
jgi:hypothetical protein